MCKKLFVVFCALLIVFGTISAYAGDKRKGLYDDDADFVDSKSVGTLVMGLYQSTPQSVTDGDLGPFQIDSSGNVIVVPASTGATVVSKTTSQDLSAAALDFSTTFVADVKITSITVKSSVAITETVTFALNSTTGANYDTTILSESLVAEQNVYYSPAGTLIIRNGDEIDVNCTNANTTGTVYVVVIGEELS